MNPYPSTQKGLAYRQWGRGSPGPWAKAPIPGDAQGGSTRKTGGAGNKSRPGKSRPYMQGHHGAFACGNRAPRRADDKNMPLRPQIPGWLLEAGNRRAACESCNASKGGLHAGIGSGPTKTMGNIADTGLRHRAGRDHPVQREPAILKER